MIITGSVGRGGVNRSEDVRLIQRLLNNELAQGGGALLVADGIAGPKTSAAIELYQRRHALTVDGRVDANGRTLKHLVEAFWKTIVTGITFPAMAASSGTTPAADSLLASAFTECLSKLRS